VHVKHCKTGKISQTGNFLMKTKEQIQEKRLEILEWEKANRNSKNRAVVIMEHNCPRCIYSGEIGCAVGRLITDKSLCERMDLCEESRVSSFSIMALLPPEIEELGTDFLSQVQDLHDESQNWNEGGLSEVGLEKWNSVKEMYCNS
jgi:hypothetical protein